MQAGERLSVGPLVWKGLPLACLFILPAIPLPAGTAEWGRISGGIIFAGGSTSRVGSGPLSILSVAVRILDWPEVVRRGAEGRTTTCAAWRSTSPSAVIDSRASAIPALGWWLCGAAPLFNDGLLIEAADGAAGPRSGKE